MNIAVFRAGEHTDMNGKVKQWTEADLDQIISQYDPARHEAPAVIGHPKDNTPAWGWVTGLSREGDTLYAEFGQLDPDFTEMLKAGRFKKRSISLYPDLSLKHVGFLGASPPAVKGLPDYKFTADIEATTIEILTKENSVMEFKEFFEAMKFWKDAVAAETPAPKTDEIVSFTEADVEKAKKEALEEGRRLASLEFAESAAKAKQEARHEVIKNKLTQLAIVGKVLPAWMKAGLEEFMDALDDSTDYQFSEGAAKQNQLDWFVEFLTALPKVIEFGEVAPGVGNLTGDPGGKLELLIAKKRAEKKDLSYSAAFAEVQTENPDLVNEYIN